MRLRVRLQERWITDLPYPVGRLTKMSIPFSKICVIASIWNLFKNLANLFQTQPPYRFYNIAIIRCDIIRAYVPRCRILPRKCPAGYLTMFCRRFLIGVIEFSLGFADCVSSRGSETQSALRRLSRPRPSSFIYIFLIFSAFSHEKTGTR